MSDKTRYQGVQQAIDMVSKEISRRVVNTLKRLDPATEMLIAHRDAAKHVSKSAADIQEVNPSFAKGIEQVCNDIYSFCSGIASNVPNVVQSDELKKASEDIDAAMALFASDKGFSSAVSAPLTGAGDTLALGILRPLKAAMEKALAKAASFEGTDAGVGGFPAGGSPPAQGSVMAIAAQSAGPSAVSIADETSANPAVGKDSLQSTKTIQAGSVLAIAAQNAGPSSVLKSEDPIAKALTSAAEAVTKRAEAAQVEEWPMDLSSWASRR